MSVPGGNILNLAMTAIAKQALGYLAYSSRTVAANGDYVPVYASHVTVYGSVQPIKRSLYDQLGLDFQKGYYNIFVPQAVTDIKRASAGDLFMYNNKSFQVLSNEPWFDMDGWDQTLCVEVPNVNFNYVTESNSYYVTEDGSQHYAQELNYGL